MSLDLTSSAEILIFMWLCECESYGNITEREFSTGLDKLGFSSKEDLEDRAANQLNLILNDFESSDFRKFFKFVFIFHREGMYKNVEFRMCASLLKMIFGDRFSIITNFLKYCQDREL